MKKYVIWYDENTNPPNADGVFTLDEVKGIIVDAYSLEEAKNKATQLECIFRNTESNVKYKTVTNIEEYNR